MAVTVADVKTLLPEFASDADSRVQLWLDEAVLLVNAGHFGNRTDTATIFLTAHFLSCFGGDNSGGSGFAVSEKSVGAVKLKFATDATSVMSTLASTKYGRQYQWLCRLNFGDRCT